MTHLGFLISRLAADLDTTNQEIFHNDSIMNLVVEYLEQDTLDYKSLLDSANTFKHTVRR